MGVRIALSVAFLALAPAAASQQAATPRDPSEQLVSLPDLNSHLRENFGLHASVPDGYPVCRGYYYQSNTGFWTMLDGSPCNHGGGSTSRPTMSVYASFNSGEEADALAYMHLGDRCRNAGWGEPDWLWAVDGLRTAMCRLEESDGRVFVYLRAMGGRTQGGSGAVPSVAYGATLSTTQARLEQDTGLFREFVSSIEITELCLRGDPRPWLQPCLPAR